MLKEQVKLLSTDITSQNQLITELRDSKKMALSDVTVLNEKYHDALSRAEGSDRRVQELEIAIARLDYQLATVKEQSAIEQQGATHRVNELLEQQRLVGCVAILCESISIVSKRRLLQQHIDNLEQNQSSLLEKRRQVRKSDQIYRFVDIECCEFPRL
jgi:chromosome segregation ATPase